MWEAPSLTNLLPRFCVTSHPNRPRCSIHGDGGSTRVRPSSPRMFPVQQSLSDTTQYRLAISMH